MPPPLDIAHLDLDALASSRIVRRGRQYARKGHVLDWRISGGRLEARVQGLEHEPYLVSVEWDGEEHLPSCTCPYDAEPFCKHTIAALAAAVGAAVGGPMASGEDADEGEWVPPVKSRRAEELDIRRKRGRKSVEEGITIRSLDGERYFGGFSVRSGSGRSYRVEIHSFKHLMNRCSCPDFQTNLLGTCKHIEAVLHRHKTRAPNKTARLAERVPPVSSVFVQRIEEPQIRVQRGARMTPRLAQVLDRHFDRAGAFLGDPATDFQEFRRAADSLRGLFIGEDAVEFAAMQAEERAGRSRKAETVARVLERKSRIPGIQADLFPYQTQGVAFLASAGRAILADDMGLGKTIQAIAACRWLMDHESVERVLVICPASLKHQWCREIERFAGLPATVVQGGVPVRMEQYRERAAFTVVNYELVLRDGKRIEELAPDIVVLDEAQRIKNWRTRTAEAIKTFDSRYAFVLTGTPIENRLDDLYSLMQVVDRRILGPLWSFNERFMDLSGKGRRVHGYRNLGKLRELLTPSFLRRDRAQVLSQLPERSDNRYYVGMTEKQVEYMDENVQITRRLLKLAEKRPLSPSEHKRLMAAFLRARMACNAAGLVDKETRGSPKLDEFARVLAEVCIESGRKVVIFSEWEQMIRRAAKRAAKLGIEHVILTGSVPTHKRGPLIDRFREEQNLMAFFSTDAGGVGLNLQAAQTVINLDLPWNPARLEQRIARVHRMGQSENVNVVLLIAEGSIEQRIEGVIEAKRELFQAVVDSDSKVEVLSTRPRTLNLMREVVDGDGDGDGDGDRDGAPVPPRIAPGGGEADDAPDGGTEKEPASREAQPPSPEPKDATPDPVRRLQEALGYRLVEVKRTRSGKLVAVVDRHDEEADRIVSEAAGGDIVVLDAAQIAALDVFGEDSPLAGAETLLAQSSESEVDNRRAAELARIARRRLGAARKLAEAGMGAEALPLAYEAMLARLRIEIPGDGDSADPAALLRAVYERLLPDGKITLEQAGAIGRIGDLARAYAGRDADVPVQIVTQVLEEAGKFVEAQGSRNHASVR